MLRFCAWAVSVFLCSRPHVKVKAVWPDVLHSATLTPTLTPTAMGQIVPVWTEWERIATPGCFFQAAGTLFLRFLALQHPGHDAADDPRRLLLHPAGRVCVDVQRKPRAAVTEHGGDCFHVHAALQRGRGEAVPLRYNNDKPEKPRNFKGLEVYQADFSSFSNPKNQATKPLFRRGG